MSTIRRLVKYFQNVLCALWVLFLAHAMLGSCAPNRISPTIEPRPWPSTAPFHALTREVHEADGYVLGTVEKAEPDWTYDDPCGIIATVLGRCDGTAAYKLTIRNADDPVRLWVFVPAKDTLVLPVGTRAVFVWKFYWAYRYADCRAKRGVSLSYCPADQLPAVLSRDAVVAPGDSSLVASLFAEKRRSR